MDPSPLAPRRLLATQPASLRRRQPCPRKETSTGVMLTRANEKDSRQPPAARLMLPSRKPWRVLPRPCDSPHPCLAPLLSPAFSCLGTASAIGGEAPVIASRRQRSASLPSLRIKQDSACNLIRTEGILSSHVESRAPTSRPGVQCMQSDDSTRQRRAHTRRTADTDTHKHGHMHSPRHRHTRTLTHKHTHAHTAASHRHR